MTNSQVYMTIAPSGGINFPAIVGVNMSNIQELAGTGWRTIAPKVNDLTVVKLSKENILGVARGLIKKNGPTVSIKADYFTLSEEHTGQTFRVGEFLVEDYDYANDKEFVRHATLDERKQYGLR
jgi:hypothetical protein